MPGLGPHHRAAATGGRLLLRERDGSIRELVPSAAFFDVADPSGSPDGRRVAFSGLVHPDSGWRIYVVGAAGGVPIAVTRTPPVAGPAQSRAPRVDDLDPCWVSDGRICFASTRLVQRAQYADLPVTNLYLARVPDPAEDTPLTPAEPPSRITAERNGAEEPAFDSRTGRILFSRWWFNRHTPVHLTPAGGLHDRPIGTGLDTANVWHCMEAFPDGSDPRMACGDFASRRGTMVYQPAVLEDGTVLGVYAANLGLSPRGGFLGIHRYTERFGKASRLAGAIIADLGGDLYSGARGLAAPSACSPAGLPDGRVLFSYAPGARGDFGISLMQPDGSRIREVVDLPGTLELDPAPLAPRRGAARRGVGRGAPSPSAGLPRPFVEETAPASAADLERRPRFRYNALNLFANGPMDLPIGPALGPRARVFLRFFAALARLEQDGGDTIVMIREVPIGADGSVDARDLPAGVPLFEQAVNHQGAVLASTHGLGHVAGLNSGYPGATSTCLGCHRGHSILTRNGAPADPAWFNAAPGAAVLVSPVARSSTAALVDRRLRAEPDRSVWDSGPADTVRILFRWPVPLEFNEIALFGVTNAERGATGGASRAAWVAGGEVIALRSGQEVAKRAWKGPVPFGGRHISLEGVVANELVIRLRPSREGVMHGVRLSEIEATARLPR